MSTLTINRNCDFRRLYYKGKAYTNPALVVYAAKNSAGICRIGITVSKKIGTAVERNRCKRVIRAAYRAVEPQLSGNWDFIFVARSRTRFLKSTQVQEILTELLQKAGAIK